MVNSTDRRVPVWVAIIGTVGVVLAALITTIAPIIVNNSRTEPVSTPSPSSTAGDTLRPTPLAPSPQSTAASQDRTVSKLQICESEILLSKGKGASLATCKIDGTDADLRFDGVGVVVAGDISTRAAGKGGNAEKTAPSACNGLFIYPNHAEAARPIKEAACLKSRQELAYVDLVSVAEGVARIHIVSWSSMN